MKKSSNKMVTLIVTVALLIAAGFVAYKIYQYAVGYAMFQEGTSAVKDISGGENRRGMFK